MEGRTCEGALQENKSVSFANANSHGSVCTIFLLYDNDINSPAEGGWVDRIPCLGDGTADTPDVLHPSKWCLAPLRKNMQYKEYAKNAEAEEW